MAAHIVGKFQKKPSFVHIVANVDSRRIRKCGF